MTRIPTLGFFVFLTCLTPFAFAEPAIYEVTFDATWSAETHPGNYPSNAHFSPLIGATHNSDVTFWTGGGISTNGIEQMAETGSTGALTTEIRAAIRDGSALEILRGVGIDSPASTSFQFEVERSHSLVSLVTMIAPSPDWFLGVHDLNLVQDDSWVETITIDLLSYDAGTDSGTGFTSGNLDTNPAEPIALLGAPLEGTPPLGVFTFQLIEVPEPGAGTLVLMGGVCAIFRRQRRR